jgi:ABC-type nitrate/sulfonate/bicarbonate transport system substrate-binding protein
MFRKLALAAVSACTLAVAALPASAAEIRMMTFGGATNLPVWVAMEKGLFDREGVKLTYAQTNGSVEQIKAFYEGKFDIISTAFDNIVAYAEGQSDIPLPGPYDMVAFMGVHGGMNSVMTPGDIKGYADIKGKTVAVDALKSGYGIVLYQILKDKGGLELDKDYKVISVGNTDKRLEAMREKKAVAAIIGAPTDIEVEKQGFKLLADAAKELGSYQGSAMVVRTSWAKDHEADMAPFIRAVVAATDMIFKDKELAISVLRKKIPSMTAEDAEKLYPRLVGAGGLIPQSKMDIKGVETVLKIRENYGEPKKKMGPVSRYVDMGYYDRAMAKK